MNPQAGYGYNASFSNGQEPQHANPSQNGSVEGSQVPYAKSPPVPSQAYNNGTYEQPQPYPYANNISVPPSSVPNSAVNGFQYSAPNSMPNYQQPTTYAGPAQPVQGNYAQYYQSNYNPVAQYPGAYPNVSAPQNFNPIQPPQPPQSYAQPQMPPSQHSSRPESSVGGPLPCASATPTSQVQSTNPYAYSSFQHTPASQPIATSSAPIPTVPFSPPSMQPMQANGPSQQQLPQPTRPQPAMINKDPRQRVTRAEWQQLKTPISLLQDKNLLPSDGPDEAVLPKLRTTVNCDPKIMRSTLTAFPSSNGLLNKCRLPLGIVMHPFQDLDQLCVIQSKVIVRCRQCRSYIHPFVRFLEQKRRWQCTLCSTVNSVPDDFYYDPVSERYGDPTCRPEVRSSTIEYIASHDYMLRPPQAATYVFCLEASRAAVVSGALRLACERLGQQLDHLPGDTRRQIAIITFDSSIHFYKFSGGRPSMMVCPDVEEVFIPDLDGLLVPITAHTETIDEVLTMIPDRFSETQDVGSCLGAVMSTAFRLIESCGGRITVIYSSLPSVGPGSLTDRESQSDRHGASVKHLAPATDFYKSLALQCVGRQVAIDQFVLSSKGCDLATLSGASRHCGGSLAHYPDFHYTGPLDAALEGPGWIEAERFREDFDRYLTRRIGFEAVLRVRCPSSISLQCFHGSCFVRSVDLLALPNVSPDSGYAIQLSINEDLQEEHAVFQTAVLYTSAMGDRRIRVHTLCLPVVHSVTEVFAGADQGAIACLLAKMAVDRAVNEGLSLAREALINAVADALKAFAQVSGVSHGLSSMLCPASLRLLAAYVCGLLRSRAFRVHSPTRLDDRVAAMDYLVCMPHCNLLPYIYPRLFPVHELYRPDPLIDRVQALRVDQEEAEADSSSDDTEASGQTDKPEEMDLMLGPMRLTVDSINSSGLFLLDCGQVMLLCVGDAKTNVDLLPSMLGVHTAQELPQMGGPVELPRVKSLANRRLRRFIARLQKGRELGRTIVLMRHDAPTHLRARFIHAMVEDRSESALSYHELLQMIQKHALS